MSQIENSEVIRKVLDKLIEISSRKTTGGYAISVMNSLIKKLEERYDFLRHIEIKDTRFSEDDNSITVMSDVDSVSPTEVGKAVHAIIFTMNRTLGKDAGHFFIRELLHNIGGEYHSTIKDMGVDLNLMQLEHEIDELEKRLFHERKID